MAKVDRSILIANDQNMGDFGDPNKLEASISHLADKIDSNDNETQSLKTENTSNKGRLTVLESDVSVLKADNASNKSRIATNEYNISENEARLTELLRNEQKASEVVDARMGFPVLRNKLESMDKESSAKANKGFGTKFTAHRGLNKAYPENTLLAFEMACLAGYKVIELDIQPTSDNVLVVHHDTTVDRMTTGTGNVTGFTLVGIKSLNVDGGAGASEYPALKVPTLEETLILLRKYNAMPMIEFKVINDFSQLDTLVALLKKYGFEYNSAIISSVTYLIDEFRKRGGKSEGLLLNSITTESSALLKSYGNCGYCLDYTVVTQNVIDSLHADGLSIAVYTVNDTATARQLRQWGADYITTDTIRGVS